MMERQLGHMVRLVDDLLDVSRISRNKMELRRSRVRPGGRRRQRRGDRPPGRSRRPGTSSTVSLPPEPVSSTPTSPGSPRSLGNLLTNSAKYTERGGRIWLDRRTAAAARSSSPVRDTGIGIPADALPRIFDMFSQVDRSIERSTGGLGIGLALVKGLVEMHGGTVTAESDGPGPGAAPSPSGSRCWSE